MKQCSSCGGFCKGKNCQLENVASTGKPMRTHMTGEEARAWAWSQVKNDVGTAGWTVGDLCSYSGFFNVGWHARKQFEKQRVQPDQEPVALNRGYTERLIEALEDNSDPVSIDAAEEFRRLLTSPPQRQPPTGEIVRLAGVALREMPRASTDWQEAAKRVCEAVAAHGIKAAA